jgi:hypothetical protein
VDFWICAKGCVGLQEKLADCVVCVCCFLLRVFNSLTPEFHMNDI